MDIVSSKEDPIKSDLPKKIVRKEHHEHYFTMRAEKRQIVISCRIIIPTSSSVLGFSCGSGVSS